MEHNNIKNVKEEKNEKKTPRSKTPVEKSDGGHRKEAGKTAEPHKEEKKDKRDTKKEKKPAVEGKSAESAAKVRQKSSEEKAPPKGNKAVAVRASAEARKAGSKEDKKEKKGSKDKPKDPKEKNKDAKNEDEKKEKEKEPAAPVEKKEFLLKEGQVLLNKFKVEGLLADGGFAQVYAAIHEDTQTRWAVKIESEKCDRKRMKLEIMVLMLLRGKANIPEIMAMGTCPTGHYIILELVGRNLSDLRRQLPYRRLTPGSLYRAMLQVTHALSLVHSIGFLHRDLKPSNCCVGVDDVTRIYLLDYGLTRQYLDGSGQIRKPRESIGMRGTLRYVSLEAHARHDLGPNHDLIALVYSIIELGDGHLPWSKMRDEAAIKASKQETTVEKLCEKQPKMLKLAEYVLAMKYETMPDYDKVLKMLESCHPPEVKKNDPYDWQTVPCQLEHFVKRQKHEDGEKPGAAENKRDTEHLSIASDMDKARH